ncbi:hypothetical protein GCM10009566_28740 [Streptomyces murinus]
MGVDPAGLAANGAPREASDTAVLTAVRDASAAGVLFPLSATHYMEIGKITDPRQRSDVARIMASVSHCRTMRSCRVLLRHQMLHAMHVSFGRPAFRPSPPRVLGIGAAWALVGERDVGGEHPVQIVAGRPVPWCALDRPSATAGPG